MKQKFGIRKTKMNIFWLLVVGLIVGMVAGLRQPVSMQNSNNTVTQEVHQ